MALSQRGTSIVGGLLVADGFAFLTNPKALIQIWSSPRAPSWYRRMMAFFDEHTGLCRALSGAELLAGATMLLRAGHRAAS